jgi:HAD superfamily hydrolase (TIGR01509 family)
MAPQSHGPATWWRGAVLFDVDGTLVDSAYVHTMAWWQAFRQHQHDVPMSAIHWCVGMGGDRLVDSLLPAGRDKDADADIMASHAAIFATSWPSLRALDGAKDLLASSARQQDLAANRRALAADAFIHAATSSDDANRSKPAPDILVAALEAVSVPAERAVYVGDAVWDMKAAAALGMPAIGLTCGGRSAAELLEAGAAEVYAGPRDLLDNLQESAIGRLLTLPG